MANWSRKTLETCPVCGAEEVQVEHTIDENDQPVHIWHCPECQDRHPVLVCWACPACAGVFRDVIEEHRNMMPIRPGRSLNWTNRTLRLQATYYNVLIDEKRAGMNKWVREQVLKFTCFDGQRPNTREEWHAWRRVLPWAIQLVGDALTIAEQEGGFVSARHD